MSPSSSTIACKTWCFILCWLGRDFALSWAWKEADTGARLVRSLPLFGHGISPRIEAEIGTTRWQCWSVVSSAFTACSLEPPGLCLGALSQSYIVVCAVFSYRHSRAEGTSVRQPGVDEAWTIRLCVAGCLSSPGCTADAAFPFGHGHSGSLVFKTNRYRRF